jgi:hypothetical protein
MRHGILARFPLLYVIMPGCLLEVGCERRSCGFFDVKCGWKHPGWWWNGNKQWVYAAGTIGSVAACFNPVLCMIGNGLMSGVSMADRTYKFVNSGAYNDGGMAWGEFALGIGIDALGFIPGAARAEDGVTSFRGTTWGDANEVIEGQGLVAWRIAKTSRTPRRCAAQAPI